MASYHLCPSYLKQETGEASAFCYAGSGDLANASVLATALTERDEGTRSGTDPAETGQSALDAIQLAGPISPSALNTSSRAPR